MGIIGNRRVSGFSLDVNISKLNPLWGETNKTLDRPSNGRVYLQITTEPAAG